MSLKDSIEQVQMRLEAMMKNYRYKKNNATRQAAVEERMEIMTCSGKLNESLLQFNTTIRTQALHIQEGIKYHRDTNLQEDELWDAAIGYMLVKDAQYALKSLYSYDSIEYAYNLLDGVTKYMNGSKLKLPRIAAVRRTKDRNMAGYLTSDKAIREKELFLEGFFEELKRTGNIEKCMASAPYPGEVDGDRRYGTSSKSTTGGSSGANTQSHRERLDSIPDDAPIPVYDIPDPSNVDIRVPTEAAVPSRSEQLRAAMASCPDDNLEAVDDGNVVSESADQ